jgi:hypothetical protein
MLTQRGSLDEIENLPVGHLLSPACNLRPLRWGEFALEAPEQSVQHFDLALVRCMFRDAHPEYRLLEDCTQRAVRTVDRTFEAREEPLLPSGYVELAPRCAPERGAVLIAFAADLPRAFPRTLHQRSVGLLHAREARIPGTWLTLCSGRRDWAGVHAVLVSIEVAQLGLQEADLPERVVDFADADQLLSERDTQVDFRLPRQMRPQRVTRRRHAAACLR